MSNKKLIIDKNISARFKQLRKSSGLTQHEFCKKIGVGQGTISGIESGKQGVSNLVKIALFERYNVNIDWLETGEGDMLRDIESVKYSETPYRPMTMEGEIIDKVFQGLEEDKRNKLLSLVFEEISKMKKGH